MLTRLQISGFKNLVDVDVRFGPFTCIAGANGVGKSNLFDAIHFLSLLADRPLIEAALEVRGARTAGVRSLFHRVGEHSDETMTFTVEMIVPKVGQDDYGQEATASSTFLTYHLELGYRGPTAHDSAGPLEIIAEELDYIKKGEAHKHLLFGHSARKWRDTVVESRRRTGSPFISTTGQGSDRLVHRHQDGGSRGQPMKYAADRLPRTVLSGSNASESPTALLARREMQSWRLLQLEPSSLRKPDAFNAPTKLGADGSYLAATLSRLARQERQDADGELLAANGRLYAQVANRLSELFEDVQELWVDRDEKRELLTVHVRTRDETDHPAPSLSDGSLRFLALAVLELDTEDRGVICLEEPENGVHPERLPAMLRLLQDITTDVEEPVGADNPLRQVIINTHSPAVVQQVPEDSLVLATEKQLLRDGARFNVVTFRSLSDTWREKAPDAGRPAALGTLLAYLSPVTREKLELWAGAGQRRKPAVVEREDLQRLLPFT